MENVKTEVMEKIKEAQKVLIGIGKEWALRDDEKDIRFSMTSVFTFSINFSAFLQIISINIIPQTAFHFNETVYKPFAVLFNGNTKNRQKLFSRLL